jgi:hypothetical protein
MAGFPGPVKANPETYRERDPVMSRGTILFVSLLLTLIAAVCIGLWMQDTNEGTERTMTTLDSLKARVDSLNAQADSVKVNLTRVR